MNKRTHFCLIAFLLLSQSVQADLGLTEWLNDSAGPALSQLIGSEPRFLGESITIVAMDDGRIKPFRDGLASRLRDDIRQLLLTRTSARVLVGQDNGNCSVPASHVVLGIDITRHDRDRHRVQLALLDLDENIWISGGSQVWIGKLSKEGRRLLEQGGGEFRGNVTPDATADIARQLVEQLGCGNRFASPIHVSVDDPALASALATALGAHYQVTSEVGLAQTRLEVVDSQTSLSLRFAGASLELARVDLIPPRPVQPLVSVIRQSDRRYDCQGQGSRCIDIEYEITQDAFVFEFFSHSGRIYSLDCQSAAALDYGLIRRGLDIPRPDAKTPGRPILGFYVLASPDPQVASQLQMLLQGDAGGCSSTPESESLITLAALVKTHNVSWRAMHFEDHGGRIRTL